MEKTISIEISKANNRKQLFNTPVREFQQISLFKMLTKLRLQFSERNYIGKRWPRFREISFQRRYFVKIAQNLEYVLLYKSLNITVVEFQQISLLQETNALFSLV